ncbi:MAG: nucleotide exchange factor GrpE, partial [Clostridia bacterium]
MSPFDPYSRTPLDPRYTPYALRRSRPVKRIKVHRAGKKPEARENIPSPEQSSHSTENNVTMTPPKTHDTPNTIDQIEQQQNVDWQAQYARLQADLENTKKRVAKRYAQQSDDLRIRLLHDLLPLADHLESALTHSEDGAGEDTLRQGVALTLKAFL